jgi:uncharacterized protein
MEEEFTLSDVELEHACVGNLPAQVLEGLELFNRGEYFEAHEVLELAWRAESEPVRELYRGILQVGVAYYHIGNGNYRGALKMLQRAAGWLAPFPDRCRGIDLRDLRANAQQVETALRRLGPEGITAFDPRLFKPVEYIYPHQGERKP